MVPAIRLVPLLALLGWLTSACTKSEAQAAPPPPTPVSITLVRPERVPIASEWIATLDGFVNAQVRPQVTGYLLKRNYDEGLAVKRDQVLFEIDPRSFRAALAQANAQLAQAEAELGRTEQEVARNTPLAREGVVAKSQLDNAVQANLSAKAQVQSAKAGREIATLNLGFTKVRSLVDGIAAIATAQIGDLVTPATLLTTVSQVDPIRAYFSLSEQEYLRVAPRLNEAKAKQSPWQGDSELTLILADGKEYPLRGQFAAADREIDPKTGTIRMSATFPNPQHLLRPGQYGRIRTQTQVLENALLVPARAVSDLQGGALVRIVGPNSKVQVRKVQLGPRVGARWVVESGLDPESRVIVDAQPAEGTPVTVRAKAE